MKCEHWTKRWNSSGCTELALSASWTHGLIAQSIRAYEWNSENKTEYIYIYIEREREREREGEKRTNKTNTNKQLLVSRLHIYQVSFNIPLLQIYYRLWRHFEISSALLFNKFLWLAFAITYFSVKQKSHLLDPHLYVEA